MASPVTRPSEPAARRRPRRSSQLGDQLVYGGCALELLADFDGWELGAEYLRFAATAADARAPLAASIRCAVSGDPSLDRADEAGRRIRWRFEDGRAQVRSGLLAAELCRTAPGRFAASARVHPDSSGVSALVSALAGAAVFLRGGFVLHAAGVVVDGRAVLFVGPSGAGKTTAANHSAGAAWFAKDRAAVVFGPEGPVAWGMAGGDAVDLPRAPARCYPLAAVLRVRRAGAPGTLEPLGLSGAVAALRESVQSGGDGAEAEASVLDAALRFAQRVPVGALHLRLGDDLTPALRAFVAQRPNEP